MKIALKSAWQLAKELAPKLKTDINTIKIKILRMAQREEIQDYGYIKGHKQVTLFNEDEVRGILTGKTKEYKVIPESIKDKTGKWIPRVDIVEDRRKSVRIRNWKWETKRFDTKEDADYYAKFAAKQKLRREG